MDAEFLILGGGLAGLTAAYELVRRGRSVVVLEKHPVVGGLARTEVREGFRFDLGGHRFHSTIPGIIAWLRDLMGPDLVQVERRSHIRLDDRLADYPIQLPNALTLFSPWKSAALLCSYVAAHLRRPGPEPSFEQWVVHRFGRGLYEVFFRPYTEKVWGMPCTELSADWAAERIRLPNLSVAVWRSQFPGEDGPATLVSRFLYPRLGIGMIVDRLAARVSASGRGEIHTAAPVSAIQPVGAGFRVTARLDGREVGWSAEQVISTIPLDDLLAMLLGEAETSELRARLQYRDLICVSLALDMPRWSSDTWIYFPDQHLVFGRVHEPRNWSPAMVPGDGTSLCLEVFCNRQDPVWRQPDQALVERAVVDLEELGMLGPSVVQKGWVERVIDAYPVYRIGYGEAVAEARDLLGRWPHLHLLGRTGTFRYQNMDAVIADAQRLVARL